MNDRFDLRRFGQYLIYDLRHTWEYFGLSGIILMCLPLIFFVTFNAILYVLNGFTPVNLHGSSSIFSIYLLLLIYLFTFSDKVYGGLTDKVRGTSWLMLPSSRLEKYASMVLITVVIVPLCIAVPFMGLDYLLNMIFPDTYGGSVTSGSFNAFMNARLDDGQLFTPPYLLLGLSLVSQLLIFLLGSLWFKSRNKSGKTFICLMALSILLMIVGYAIMKCFGGDFETILGAIASLKDASSSIRIGWYAWEIIWVALPAVVIYYRLKTLKH